MGIDEVHEETLNLARRIAMFNSEIIFNIKHGLIRLTEETIKKQKESHEKFSIIIKNSYPKCEVSLILANPHNNENHDITKLDVDLIQQMLKESLDHV